MRGTNSSQTPASRRRRIGCRRPSQVLKLADNGHAARVRRPNCKADALDAADSHRLRPKASSELVMRALGDQMQIELAEQKAEAIWVLRLLNCIGPQDAQAVGAAANHRTGE